MILELRQKRYSLVMSKLDPDQFPKDNVIKMSHEVIICAVFNKSRFLVIFYY